MHRGCLQLLSKKCTLTIDDVLRVIEAWIVVVSAVSAPARAELASDPLGCIQIGKPESMICCCQLIAGSLTFQIRSR